MARPLKLPSAVQAMKDAIEKHESGSPPAANTDDVVTDPPASPPHAADPPAPAAPAPLEPVGDEIQSLRAANANLQAQLDVLKGKYNAELPALRDENRQLQSDLADLTQAMSERGGRHEPAPSPTEQDETDAGIVGPDALEVFKRQAEAIVQQRLAPVAKDVARSNADKFREAVTAKCSDWRAVQTHANFQAYMSEPHPDTGLPRGEHLNDAVRSGDADRAARIYTNAKQALGMGAPVVDTSVPTPPTAAQTLADRAVPVGTGAASAPPTPRPKIYTSAEVTKGYTDLAQCKAQGRFHGKEKEKWEAWERDITNASRENRVVSR